VLRRSRSGRSTTPGRVTVLSNNDLGRVWHLLDRDPVQNLFVASRVRQGGLNPATLGCEVWGYEVDDELTALLHVGSNLVPVEADEEALGAFVERLGPRRRCASLMGPSITTMRLFQLLRDRWSGQWEHPRDIRPHQPMLAIDREPDVPGDPRVHRVGPEAFAAYFDAAVRMYTEEVGVSPLSGGRGYEQYVRSLVTNGRAFGIIEDARVLFKSDIGSADRRHCQIQGVWLEPSLRGQGLSVPAMAEVVRLARLEFPVVTLYVNDFNTPARALYARVGFEHAAEFATVLY